MWYIYPYYLRDELLQRQNIIGYKLYPASFKEIGGVRWGYINDRGEFIIKHKYDFAYDFQDNNLAIIGHNGKTGVINESGKYVVKPNYSYIEQFSQGLATATNENGASVIDEKGNVITQKFYSYIGNFKNSRAVFNVKDEKSNLPYGYLDKKGREVIPNKYKYANDFVDKKAVVKLDEGEYALIDLKGNILRKFKYDYVGNFGDGLLAFREKSEGKYGFIDENGIVVIRPKFTSTTPFSEGMSVVNISEDYKNKYGLIDKKGKFIINPEYNDIQILGEDRVAVGIPIDKEKPYAGSKYAIYDNNGNRLTDFLYYGVSKYKDKLASVYDGNYTFFINKKGVKSKNLPVFKGSGTLLKMGNIIKGDVDQRVSYVDIFGNVIYKQNTIIPLNNKYNVKEEKFRPNRTYLVYYPQLSGIKDEKIQHNVNSNLKKLSQVKEINNEDVLEYEYVGDFEIEFFKKHLCVLNILGYEYHFGAAHGMPIKIYPHIDLISGKFYELKDLFKENSDYVKVLTDIIKYQIKTNKEYEYIWPDAFEKIKKNQPFYVNGDNLYIYFYPYEIAPYAAGFPTFKILFKDIMDIIDVEGEFWKSFN